MRKALGIALSILAGLLACGLPLWPIAYREVSMPGNPSPMVWLCLGALAGLIAGYLNRRGFWIPVLSVAAGFVLAIQLRVGWDVGADPTSHNLWPFEVAIAGFFGLISGLVGVGLARGAQRIAARR